MISLLDFLLRTAASLLVSEFVQVVLMQTWTNIVTLASRQCPCKGLLRV